MILFPNAKINIGLHVTSKRSDGFHNIHSEFYPVDLFDILEIVPNKTQQFTYSGIEINEKENLLTKTFSLIKKHFPIENYWIHLHKQIPLGAGLGGGSSDAAFLIMGINKLADLKLSIIEMEELALQIGSDCPFFIENKPKLVSGRGEILSPPMLDLKGKFIYLINTGIHISTQETFGSVKPFDRPFPKQLSALKNDFEEGIFDKYPSLKIVKEELLNYGAFYASMTGTGSTIYGLFDSKPKKMNQYEFEFICELK
ncbi:4-(cytidine 5'-diphospho)-2-C-methyl-D-erythritol kinase [Paracrocinitomix mangrovi]|uniref:4-(cytidine 5'-diphospho)-2-C-methyl-D-erythritol kinase n=1 Tax=Paracrocinitomix mangrovi TaxID=2862509 RepID=UPI001C8DFC44|nr:4-(cytidine 5'-diphospho)-2-C-methyl-D-erythritol kinase [Paracrocinitomix mangrovi]UKN02465.1 4-(cytidine 5'-diphospho)-2-C-methyl-D-erythritol kinase [Paracrocinitomix mangrovi]